MADIAEKLLVSRSTVRKPIFNTLQGLGAHSQLEAIALARRYGLLQSEPHTLPRRETNAVPGGLSFRICMPLAGGSTADWEWERHSNAMRTAIPSD